MTIEQIVTIVVENLPTVGGLVLLAVFQRADNKELFRLLEKCFDRQHDDDGGD